METSSAETGSSQTIKLRVDCKSTRHADSLAAAAIQLVRICIDEALCQADCIDLIRQLVISKGDCILGIISRYAGISLCLIIIATGRFEPAVTSLG